MKKTIFSFYLIAMILLLGCSGDNVAQNSAVKPISGEVEDGWSVDRLMGMQYKVPETWTKEESTMVDYRIRGEGYIGRRWDFVPIKLLSTYEDIKISNRADIEGFKKVEQGFWPLMRPVFQLTLVDKAAGEFKAENIIGTHINKVLLETDKYYYIASYWEVDKDKGLSAEDFKTYQNNLEEAQGPKMQVVTGEPLTQEYAFNSGMTLKFQSGTKDGLGATEEIFKGKPKTLLFIWSGKGEAVTKSHEYWKTNEKWGEIPVVGVVLPDRNNSQEELLKDTGNTIPMIIADEQWDELADLITTVPTYLVVGEDGTILEMVSTNMVQKNN